MDANNQYFESTFSQQNLFYKKSASLGGAFQMTDINSENCFEHLNTNGLGLDRAPAEFLTFVFLRPPNALLLLHQISINYIQYTPFT